MLAQLTHLGQFHTLLSLLALGAGTVALLGTGQINPRQRTGQVYFWSMLVTSLTAFGLSKSGGFNAGHVLSLITLAVLGLGAGAQRLSARGRAGGYLELLGMSLSYLLLWIFATTETLSRFPLEHPFATGPNDPALNPVRLVLLMLFVVGLAWQWRQLQRHSRLAAMPAAVSVVR